jgi:hypothetical protein
MDASCSLFCGFRAQFAGEVGLGSFELRLAPGE